jgi:UDP-N-acetylglucosamine--N-acetylmuramyl-(pentapeptide) pyrophosphoryl-undecaprenol N-acetylglucosamine transferase
MQLPAEATVLFVMGGSHGSAALNGAVTGALPALMEIPGITILWQTGPGMHEEVTEAVDTILKGRSESERRRVALHPYIDDMAAAWRSADLAICRAGASTIAELTLYGVPSMLVPLATAAGGHQEANARAMVEAGAARLLPEKELSGDRISRELGEVLTEDELLAGMAVAAKGKSASDGSGSVAEGLLSIARWLNDVERSEMLAQLRGGSR